MQNPPHVFLDLSGQVGVPLQLLPAEAGEAGLVVVLNNPGVRRGTICAQLNSRDISRVDLVIRWGGMRRLSGFLPVQSVYADFFVVDRLWPDFQPEDFFQALQWYQKQDVTLGG